MNKATQIERLKKLAETSHEYDVIEGIIGIVEELEIDLQRDTEDVAIYRGDVETRINGKDVKVPL